MNSNEDLEKPRLPTTSEEFRATTNETNSNIESGHIMSVGAISGVAN